MQILRSLADYSYGRADNVRRAMSKKKKDVMEAERVTFIEGCAKKGINAKVADDIFNQIADFAKYAFNKSHAACYSLVAYRTAYLKRYYPAEFMAALLTSVLDSSNKVARYIAECKRLGLKLSVPDVNKSVKGFFADGNSISYGLLGIKNLGSEFINDIIKERQNGQYKNLFDFCSRLINLGHFNRRAVESLIRCGALDSLGSNRRAMLQALPALVSNLEEHRRKTMYGQVGFFDLGTDDNAFGFDFEMPDVDEFPKNELLKMEKEITGLFLSGHPLDKYDDIISALGYARTVDLLEDGGINAKFQDGGNVAISGIISHITLKQTKKGDNMAFVTIEDLYGSIEIIVFPNALVKYNQFLIPSSVITVFGTLSLEEEKDAKVLANVISGAPKQGDKAFNSTKSEECKTQPGSNKNKKRGLFLRFDSKYDHNIEKAKNVVSIFDGSYPLYFYYLDEKKYELQNRQLFVDVNKTMLLELKRILGNDNVVFVE